MRPRFTRDLMVCFTATSLLVFEVVYGGGRTPVLTSLCALLVSPLVMRVDEARKEKNGRHRADENEDQADAAS